MTVPHPSRGGIWSVSFDPVVGREQAGTRPALVLSVNKFNQGPAELVVVLPLTTKNKRQPLHVPVHPPEGGLTLPSFIRTDDIRSISKHRLKKFHGDVSPQTMIEVEMRIRILLGL